MRKHFSKKLGLSLSLLGMATAGMFIGQDAEAMPGFARQTGMPCSACHFQTFPVLNSMGRAFKQGGYTMEGAQPSIEGENQLKLPVTINIGGVIKIRHTTLSSDFKKKGGSSYGQINFPDEASLLTGGRASANSGYLWEISIINGSAGLANAKHVFNAGSIAGVDFQVIPYNGSGPAYGQELMNTGALELQQISADKTFAAPFRLGFNGKAIGVDFVAQTANWTVNYNKFTPADSNGVNKLNSLATYVRAVYFMNIAGFDTGLGVAKFSGSAGTAVVDTAASTDPVTGAVIAATYKERKLVVGGSFVDFQAQGEIAGLSTGLWLSSGSAPAAGKDPNSMYYSGSSKITDTVNGRSASGLGIKLGVASDTFLTLQKGNLAIGGATTNRTSVGIQYMIAQNLKFQFNNVVTSPAVGASVTKQQVMLFMGL